jgi:hypothetical protein
MLHESVALLAMGQLFYGFVNISLRVCLGSAEPPSKRAQLVLLAFAHPLSVEPHELRSLMGPVRCTDLSQFQLLREYQGMSRRIFCN